MSPADGLIKSGAFGDAVEGKVPEKGSASATVGGVAGADVTTVQSIIAAGSENGVISTARIDHSALAAKGKEPTVVQPGGVDLSTLSAEELEGKAGYTPRGLYVEDEEVPKNANNAPSAATPS